MRSKVKTSLEEGILLFNRRQFFEAHEIWEDGWRVSEGDNRLLLHGLIQVAAGFHKLQCGRPAGAASLLEKGIEKLAGLGGAGRIDLSSLVASARSWKESLDRVGVGPIAGLEPSAFPTLAEPGRRPFLTRLLTDIEIEASSKRVWKVLTDFDAYPTWNPFLRSVEGELRPGRRLVVSIAPPDSRTMTFRPRILRAQARRELRWVGRWLLPGLFDGEHVFSIAPLATGRVRFSQRATFRGLLVPLLGRSLFERTRRGFEEMNRALKRRAAP